MRPFQLEAPTATLFDASDLHLHLRVDTTEQDPLLSAYIAAAVGYLDGYSGRLGRCILKQKWAFPLNDNTEVVYLPFPDCRDFAVEREQPASTWTALSGVDVQIARDAVFLAELPDDLEGVHLTCYAGWDTPAKVPAPLKQAVRMLVAHWFDNRAEVTVGQAPHQLPAGVEMLISPYKNVFV